MTDYHLGPLFRFIPDGEPEILFVWPKITLTVSLLETGSNEYLTDIIEELLVSEEEDTQNEYDFVKFYPDFGVWLHGNYIKTSMTWSLTLNTATNFPNEENYPVTPESPDSPDGGTYHFVSGTVNLDWSADVPRRFLKFHLPNPPLTRVNNEVYEWLSSKAQVYLDGDDYRVLNREDKKYKWPASHNLTERDPGEWFGSNPPAGPSPGQLPGTQPVLDTVITPGDPNTFIVTMVVGGVGIYTTTYTVDRIYTPSGASLRRVDFWSVGDPVVYG